MSHAARGVLTADLMNFTQRVTVEKQREEKVLGNISTLCRDVRDNYASVLLAGLVGGAVDCSSNDWSPTEPEKKKGNDWTGVPIVGLMMGQMNDVIRSVCVPGDMDESEKRREDAVLAENMGRLTRINLSAVFLETRRSMKRRNEKQEEFRLKLLSWLAISFKSEEATYDFLLSIKGALDDLRDLEKICETYLKNYRAVSPRHVDWFDVKSYGKHLVDASRVKYRKNIFSNLFSLR